MFSLILWPAALYWWNNRKTQSVPGFLVTFTAIQIATGQELYEAVMLSFINRTGSVVYLSRARSTEVQKNFPVP
jgi:hypothetical protein